MTSCELSRGCGLCSSSVVEAAAGCGDWDGGLSIGDSASDRSRSEVVEVAVAAAAGVESCFPCEKMGVVAADIAAGLTPRCDNCRACCCC